MIQSVKLSKLVLSEVNVRKRRADKAESFAISIAANGILQNLIVTPLKKPRGHFGVVAGESRYRGLMLLAERGEINADDYDVPVKLMTGAESQLSEVSLVENFQRDAMNPADECRGFQLILSQGGDIDGLARRFGVTRRFVEGRLRLANLAEPIFDALADEKIGLEMAKAYGSTASHDRQLKVWNTYGHSSYYNADAIRRMIANDDMRSSDPVALLVGAVAYEAAGGIIERELFSEGDDRWSNPEIVQKLAAEKMEAEAKRIGEERGLAWIRPVASNSTYDAARGLYPVNLPTEPMTEEQGIRAVEIEALLEPLQEQLESGTLADEAYLAIEEQYDALAAELHGLENRPVMMPAELAPRVGTFLTLSHAGEMVLDDTFYSETPLTITMVEPDVTDGATGAPEGEIDDDASDEAGEDGQVTTRGVQTPTFRIEEGTGRSSVRGGTTGIVEPDRAAPGGKQMSQVLLDQLAIQRRDVLGAALQANPGLALDYMIFTMIEARSHRGTGNGTTIRAALPQDPVLANNVPPSRARDYLAEVHDSLDATWTEATDKVARFEAFRMLADETKAAWMAWIVATSFEAKEGYGATQQIPLQNRLATILEIDVASWWRPTSENFFDRVPKGALLSLLDEVGGPALTSRHASSKKPEISASCQKLFAGDAIVETEIKDKALAWVPSAMRFNDKPSDELAGDDGQDELAGLIGHGSGDDDDEDLGALIGDGNGEPDEDDEMNDAGESSGTDDVPHPDHQNDDTTNDLVAAE